MRAIYDLNRKSPSFDFFTWLVLVKAMGATSVVLGLSEPKSRKWDRAGTLRRIESIVLPGPALAGLPWSEGKTGEIDVSQDFRALMAFVNGGGRIDHLRSVLQAGTEEFTVTLRNTERTVHCNSDESAWREFAARIGARVIEDYDVQPIGLHERVALYAGARMNFFVGNGPGMLCIFCGFPAMVFDIQKRADALQKCGIKFGEQLPFAGPEQRWVWEPDELEVIERHFKAWQEDA